MFKYAEATVVKIYQINTAIVHNLSHKELKGIHTSVAIACDFECAVSAETLKTDISYSLIQNNFQGGVIFVPSPRLFYCTTRNIGYTRCSLTGNKNYSLLQNLNNTMQCYTTPGHAEKPTQDTHG